MRASRMLSILTTLQARGRVTAPALAEACEVSVRTIYRDIDALAASGVPVYADRGAEGGYRLLDGYRVRLNGLSQSEAGALFLAGLPGPAAALGLDAAMIAAQNKLMAALPENLREDAGRMQERFHLDAPGWFGEAEDPRHLRAIAGAVLRGTLIRIRYQSWRAEKQRRVAPLGLVLKGGSWYLAGQVDDSVRTYRVARACWTARRSTTASIVPPASISPPIGRPRRCASRPRCIPMSRSCGSRRSASNCSTR